MNEAELLEYACEKFQDNKFDEALEAFALSYCKGYEQDWILENIYKCYMEANQEEFQKSYSLLAADEIVPYEECLLDFIPYKDGEYYIFDKEKKIFRGVFSIPKLKETKPDALFETMEFSAAVVCLGWNWNERLSILTEAKEREIYVISHDIKRSISFLKIPELEEYRKNIRIFSDYEKMQEYFHQHTAEYLPQLIFGTEAERTELTRILEQEHKYRLTPEGRNTDNVLLTIAIPTLNRGHLVLKRLENLRNMLFDAEIEFAISQNYGELYLEEYEEVSKIPDARIQHYAHQKFLKAAENWQYVIGMAHGKYVLIVSDEDDVAIQAVEHYLKVLTSYPDVTLIRARSIFQSSTVTKRIYKKRGRAAFYYTFMNQSYFSGLIIRRDDFVQEDFSKLERFAENQFYRYYPHECWCAILSQKGDYMEEPVILIYEGDSMFKEEETRKLEKSDKKEKIKKDIALPHYATYEQRLKQFRGIVEFLQWMMGDNQDGIAAGLYAAIGKMVHLLAMARSYEYDCEHYIDWMDQFVSTVMEAIDNFHLDAEYRIPLLEYLKNGYIYAVDVNQKLKEEAAEIGVENV